MTRSDDTDAAGTEAIRLDRWLVHARFVKTRALAQALVEKGRMRVNAQPVSKPGRLIRPGDVLTFAQGKRIRLIKVIAPGTRRGPPAEAQGLYLDLDAGADAAERPATDNRATSPPRTPFTG